MSDFITIYAEATPNPDSMKFVVSKMILPNDSVDYRTRDKAEGNSPLAVEIFDTFKFANGVFIMNNFVSITKLPDVEWVEHITPIREFIKNYIESGKEIISSQKHLTPEEEGEIETKIIRLLDDHVKPAVEMDGGAISFKSFKDGVVTVVMKGSCSGCPSSTFTLKAGIENLLKRMVPQVEAVEAEAE
jgi:Fe-S cluster biogenesis protein NfuA